MKTLFMEIGPKMTPSSGHCLLKIEFHDANIELAIYCPHVGLLPTSAHTRQANTTVVVMLPQVAATSPPT